MGLFIFCKWFTCFFIIPFSVNTLQDMGPVRHKTAPVIHLLPMLKFRIQISLTSLNWLATLGKNTFLLNSVSDCIMLIFEFNFLSLNV